LSDTMKSKIRLPVSANSLDALLRKKFRDIYVADDGVHVISRGFELHYLLEALSNDTDEKIIAEHSSSVDLYTKSYIVEYKCGNSRTLKVLEDYLIYWDEEVNDLVTEPIINKVRELLEQNSDHEQVCFEFIVDDLNYSVTKNFDMAKIEVKRCFGKKPKTVDKNLIPELNTAAEGQKPKDLCRFHKRKND
jgi:hypothetical protein